MSTSIEGAFPLWFLLFFGLVTLVCGVRYALRPHVARLKLVIALALTTWFSSWTAVCADLARLSHALSITVAQRPHEPFASRCLQGIAESLGKAVIGFTVLTLTALFVALGCYREWRHA